MKIGLGSDHGGFEMKQKIKDWLAARADGRGGGGNLDGAASAPPFARARRRQYLARFEGFDQKLAAFEVFFD